MSYSSKVVYNSYCKERYLERRQEALALLGGKCSNCESLEKLEFDHVDRSIKNFSITKKLHGLPWEKVEKELKLCQLLCRACHKKKTSSERMTKEHGRRAMWSRCKCDTCRDAKNKYHRAWRAKRKITGA